MKSKLPLGKFAKKAEEEDDDLVEDSENTEDVAMGRKSKVASASDKTSVTDVADVSNISADDLDEEEGPVSLVDKIKAKFSSKKSTSEKKIAAKTADPKRKVIIYGAVIVLLALLFWDEIFPPETVIDTSVDQAAVPALKAKGYKKKPKTPVEAPAEVTPAPVPEASSTETAPVPVEATPTPEVLNTPTQTPAIEESATRVEAEAAPKIEEVTPVETTENLPVEATSAPKIEEVVPDAPVVSESVDSVDGQVKESSDENMTEKILEDLEKQAKTSSAEEVKIREYVSPPDYEYRGRGLVYNCVGKHWACVDAPSFKTCQNNSEGNKYLKKKVECYPVNVYQNQKGCEIVQNRMVSASTKTNFCSGN